jgi:predicted ATP-grasp superfamily ATP-dependent carboligase
VAGAVVVLDDELSVARVSRHVTRFVHVPDLRDDDRALAALTSLGPTLGDGRWVLFPTREETVVLVSRHRDLLSRWYDVPTPGFDVVRTAWDKRETYRRAERVGVPSPRTWFPRGPSDLEDVPFDRPVIVKPAIKEHFIYATKAKAWRVDDPAQLREAYDRAAEIIPADEVMLQEVVPGEGQSQLAYGALYRDGRPIAEMTATRLRQHPSDFGRASTFVETAELPDVRDLARRFLDGLGFEGLVEVEFKRDPRDGRPKLLDVNARTWGYHTLAAAAGVDFPYLLVRDRLGEPPPTGPVQTRPGVRWVRLETDVPNAVRDVWRGRLRPRDYLRSLRRVDTEAVFARDDPLPGLLELALTPYLAMRRGL